MNLTQRAGAAQEAECLRAGEGGGAASEAEGGGAAEEESICSGGNGGGLSSLAIGAFFCAVA